MSPGMSNDRPGTPPDDARERLIVALDLPSAKEAAKLVAKLKGTVSFFKIGLEMLMSAGPGFARELVAEGNKVFLDGKFLDVEETVRRAVEQVARMGATFLTVHYSHKTVETAVKAAQGSQLKILTVTVLTSMGSDDVQDLGFPGTAEELVLQRVKKVAAARCDGVIASGQEAAKIREMTGERLLIVTPGIRPAGASSDEHKRLTTPADAIRAGADYLVVGRPIRDAADPRQAAERILEEMQLAWKSKEATAS